MNRFIARWGILTLLIAVLGGATAASADDLPTYDIVVVGGEKAISAEVFAALEALTSGSVVRVAGANRYETAAAVSAVASEPGVPVAFVATGENFPDALVAGPIAARGDGSVLLVEHDHVPEPTRQELLRLQPQRVVALGGELAIGQPVLDELADIAGVPVDVLSGPNRFSTAAAVSRSRFSPGVPVAYIATGLGFADALTTVPAAAVADAPILLTGGSVLPAATREELERLQPGGIVVVGGKQAVSDEVLADLAAYTTGTVERVAGASREATAAEVSEHAFPAGSGIVFIATGADFPDALAIGAAAGAEPHTRFTLSNAGPAAGQTPGPVLLTRPDSLPAETVAELDRLGKAVPAPLAEDQDVETDFQTPVDITLTGAGSGGPPFTFDVTAQPQHGTLTGTPPDVTYTPDAGFTGTDTFEFTASIGAITSAPATVTVTVHPPDAPVADDQSVTTPFETPVAVTLTGSSPGGLPLTYAIETGPANGTLSGTPPNVTYTPDPGFGEADDTFTFTVSDGLDTSPPGTVTVFVEPEAPEAHDMPGESTAFDTPVDITLDATNHSGNALTYEVVSQPANGSAVLVGGGPDVTYTPDWGFSGPDTFTFRVNDGFNDSNTATVTVTVGDPPLPVANAVNADTPFETAALITLDGESPSGGPLTYEIVSQPANGSAVLVGDGPDVTYTPDAGFGDADDTFTYRVNDTFADSNTATVTVFVEPEPPVAHDMPSEETEQDTPVVITLDATNHSSNPLTYHYAQPDDGTVTGAGPGVTYTPDPGFYGEDTFTFHVNDGYNDSNTATVTVTVNFAAEDYDFDAVGNTLLEVGVAPSGDPAVPVAATLLDDPPGPGFEVEGVDTSGSSGAVDWNTDGTFTYEPAAGFTGDDTFTYTIGDGNVSGSGTVTVTVTDLVWYVDAGSAGDGRSWSPFGSLAGAESDSGTGDIIFVYEGSYTAGIALQADQTLLGEEAGLSVGGHDLVDPGNRPDIDAAAGDAITLASGVAVQGIDVTGAAGRGLVAAGPGGTVTVDDVDVSGVTGNAVHLGGPGDFTFTAVDVTNSGSSAVFLDGLSGTVTHGGTIAQSGTSVAVSIANLAASADVSLGAVSSSASGVTVAASGGEVTIPSATLGSSGSRISGQPALTVSGGDGTVTVTTLTGYTQNAPVLALDSAGTVVIGGGTLDAQGSLVISADTVDLDIDVATANSSGSTGRGLELIDTTGSVDLAAGSVTGSTGDAVHVSGGSVGLTAGVNVTNASGHAVRVDGLSGGSVSLSGSVTDTGSGVNLSSNTGSTVAFTGVVDVTTSGSTAFAATGGGTVTTTAAGSTLAATNGRGLQVTGTTIGAAGLTFESISASGSVHGIELSNAGSGALVVAGDGSALRNGNGGTVSGMSSHGVTLTNTGPVTLRNMDVVSNGHVGVRADTVTGLTLVALELTGNTDDENNPATRNSVWLRQVTGSVAIEDSLVSDSVHNQIDVENSSGVVTVAVTRTEVRDNGINSALQVEAIGTSDVTVTVDDSQFVGHHATAVHAFARDSASLDVTIQDSTFDGNNIAANLAAQNTASISSTVTGNTVSGHASHSINVTVHEDATHDATVTGNTIDTTDTVASVGLRLVAEDQGLLRAHVADNSMTGQTSGHGVRLLAREGTPEVHLVLEDNHATTTSPSPAFSLEVLDTSTLCGVISGNTGSSSHPSRDLFVDLFDATASGQFEGAPLGALSQADLITHLETANPGPRGGAFVDGNATGVAADTCQRP